MNAAQEKHPLRGVAMVLAAAVLWGTTGTAQGLWPLSLPADWVGALRLAVAALAFWALQAVRPGHTPWRALPWRGMAAAGACMVVYNLSFFAGVRACGVAVGTAVAIGSGPLWAGALQALLHGQRPAPAWWAGTAVSVAGVVAMAWGGGLLGGGGSALGIGLCLLTGLSYAVFALVNQGLVQRADPARVTTGVFTLAALGAVPVALAWSGLPQLSATEAGVVLWLGVASTALAYWLFGHALRHVSAATGVVLALAEPVTAFVLAVAVLGERPGLAGVAGLAAVLAGLALVVRAERAPG